MSINLNITERMFFRIVHTDLYSIVSKYISLEEFVYTDTNLESINYYYHKFNPSIDKLDTTKLFEKVTKNGQLETAKWILETFVGIEQKFSHILPELFYSACTKGHLKYAEWLIERFHLTDEIVQSYDVSKLFAQLCIYGRLEVAKWLFKKFKLILLQPKRPGANFFVCVCSSGHLNMVKWLVKNFNYTMDHDILNVTQNIYGFELSCVKGFLDIAKWIFDNFEEQVLNLNILHIFEKTCHQGMFNVAKWLNVQFRINDSYINSEFLFNQACIKGYLKLAKWVYKRFLSKRKPMTIKEHTFSTLCSDGKLEILQWLNRKFDLHFDNNFLLTVLLESYENKHLDVSKWIYERFDVNAILSDQTALDFLDIILMEKEVRLKYLLAIYSKINFRSYHIL